MSMMTAKRRRLTLVLLMRWVMVASAAAPAQASCEAGIHEYVNEMPIACVGTVVAQRSARVQLGVEAVWRGPDLAPQVWVVNAVDNVAALRPATVSDPVPDGASGARRPVGAGVVALAAAGLLIGVTGAIRWWRRS